MTCHNCTTYGTPKCPDCAFKKYDTLCIEHPRIREYLMQDVIQELERRMKKSASYFAFDKEDIYEDVISLLKGVKE